jgi:hypothetical protein
VIGVRRACAGSAIHGRQLESRCIGIWWTITSLQLVCVFKQVAAYIRPSHASMQAATISESMPVMHCTSDRRPHRGSSSLSSSHMMLRAMLAASGLLLMRFKKAVPQ